MDERCSMDERREFPRRKVALTLGVTCFFLLLANTGLRYMRGKQYHPQAIATVFTKPSVCLDHLDQFECNPTHTRSDRSWSDV
ncbi:uncharacterized protein LOC102950942 [Panthera tigris]|uniref:uncharacterized protein LOC102950942 n=1 Tax=Panthera tigris TaxID=9694 RepID=UPI001C6F8C13|nr:uncharacterized protein LOC102950942 [Panthera tigris]